jgi:hypothetical protein
MERDDDARLSPWVALASIFAFWAFYFSIITLRSFVVKDPDMVLATLGQRAIVTLISAGTTILLYLALRRASASTFRRNIIAAALLAVPAAFVFAAVHYAIFDTGLLGHITALAEGQETRGVLQLLAPNSADADMSPMMGITGDAVDGYFYFATWAALYLLLCHGVEIRALERRAAALRAAAQTAELRALRYQINPHFLFNTLNSLSSLVMGERRDAAERMIGNLAAFFRTSLAGDPAADVPLSEEIYLQQLYLDIEAVRFPERLAVAIDIPDALQSARVPALILQPLIENAVRHGVARSRAKVTIRITARSDAGRVLLDVDDDGDGARGEGRPGGGLGLRNVRDRLAARFGPAAGLEAGPMPGSGYRATISMPLDCNGR